MNYIRYILVLLVILVGCSQDQSHSAEQSDQPTLTVSTAVSLSNALQEIKQAFEAEHNIELQFNFGGSGSLAQQIQQGAPVDVFISANQIWMDQLADKGFILTDSLSYIAENRLVLIAQQDAKSSYESFADLKPTTDLQLAIGHPDSVPAGQYAKQVLDNLELWEPLENQLILAKDVRQVLTYVETGNADLGIVYESDTYLSEQTKILAIADHHLHEPIRYPIAIISATPHHEAAKQFVEFMHSETAQSILERYGFKR